MRRPFLLFYVLVFLDEVALLAIVPLVPAYTRAYHLSDVKAGGLLSAASLANVVASVPAGRLSDRFGAWLVTLVASGIAGRAMLGGVGVGVINLVAPLQLGDLGLSSGEIGAWFSVASTIFIGSSLAVARVGRRAVSLRLAGLMAVFQAFALIPVLLSGAIAPIILTVLVRSVAVGPPYAM